MTMTATEVAQNGAALLDEALPGWDQEIDLIELRMDEADRCILGQLTGGYIEGVQALGWDIKGPEVKRHGFLQTGDTLYADLTRAWRDLIGARRG